MKIVMDDIIDLIENLKEKVRVHETQLSKNEALVRYSIIDPFLRSLGWDTSDPSQVIPEFSTEAGRPDYALFVPKDKKPIAFVGAKKLGKAEDLNQHISYCVEEGVEYFIATDGQKWEIYDTFKRVKLSEKKVVEWDLLADEPSEIAFRALSIANTNSFGLLPTPSLFDQRKVQANEELEPHTPEGPVLPSSVPEESPINRGTYRKSLEYTNYSNRHIELVDIIQAGLIEPNTMIYRQYKGKTLRAHITEEGKLKLEDGTIVNSLSDAARKLTSTSINGWVWWYIRDNSGKEYIIDNLRQKLSQRGKD